MHRDWIHRPTSPDGHQKGPQYQVGGHAGLCQPTDDTAEEQVDDDAEVQPAFMGLDIGDVCNPNLIRCICLEPLLQPGLCHDGRLAAVSAGSSLVADLDSDPGQRRQAGDPVLRDASAPITEIVRQLAVAINLYRGRSTPAGPARSGGCLPAHGGLNLPNRITPHRDLMHRIPLELVAVIACPHIGILASKLGGKAATNLGAPQGVVPISVERSDRSRDFLPAAGWTEPALSDGWY